MIKYNHISQRNDASSISNRRGMSRRAKRNSSKKLRKESKMICEDLSRIIGEELSYLQENMDVGGIGLGIRNDERVVIILLTPEADKNVLPTTVEVQYMGEHLTLPIVIEDWLEKLEMEPA